MFLVSFSSAEDVLSNDAKELSSQGTENLLFRFLGDTQYMCFYIGGKQALFRTNFYPSMIVKINMLMIFFFFFFTSAMIIVR